MENVILSLIFFASALLCIAIEIFILPGFGVVGILGIILLVAAVIYSWITLGSTWGIGMLVISFLVFVTGTWLVSKTSLGKRFVQSESLKGATSAPVEDYTNLIGKIAVAISDLHPVGTAMVGEKKIEVITNGVFIKKGAKLKIIEVIGSKIIVEEIKEKNA